MNNFVVLFNEIHNKFMENFYKNENKVKINSNDGHYLDIIYSLKKITLTRFAELANVTKPAATQIVNKFINKGYVTKSVCENDRRVCYIELTEQVKKIFTDNYNKLNKLYRECLSFLTDEEMSQFNQTLLKINDNLN